MPVLVTMRIVWGSILASTVILFLAGSMIVPRVEHDRDLKLALIGIACVTVVCVGFFRVRKEHRKMIRGLDLHVRDEPGAPDGGYRGVSLGRKVIADADAPARVLRLYNTAVIFGLFFAEMPAILGLLARMIGGTAIHAFGMTAISWIAMGIGFPTKKAAYKAVEDVYGAVIDDLGAR